MGTKEDYWLEKPISFDAIGKFVDILQHISMSDIIAAYIYISEFNGINPFVIKHLMFPKGIRDGKLNKHAPQVYRLPKIQNSQLVFYSGDPF